MSPRTTALPGAALIMSASLWLCSAAAPARLGSAAHADERRPHARVVVERAHVRAGPGAEFRVVYVGRRDEVLPVRSRARADYWLQVELPDGTLGYVAGDVVYVLELDDDAASGGRFMPWLFAPPPMLAAHGEVAITAGVLGDGGMLALRPTVLLDPAFGFELSAGAAVATGGRLLSFTAGPVVNLLPTTPIVPFATLQGGLVVSSPNADTFLLESGSMATLAGGVGLRIGFRYRITLRLELREHLFFEPDRTVSQEELSAGLTVFF
jgi:hypothetical protein